MACSDGSAGAAPEAAPKLNVVECGRKLMVDLSGSVGTKQLRADVAELAEAVRGDAWWLLLACIIVDMIGFASYLLPFIGEITDVPWAPISAFIVHYMFGSLFFSTIGFIEEILPFTDIVPTATIVWCISHFQLLQPVRQTFAVRRGAPLMLTDGEVEVEEKSK